MHINGTVHKVSLFPNLQNFLRKQTKGNIINLDSRKEIDQYLIGLCYYLKRRSCRGIVNCTRQVRRAQVEITRINLILEVVLTYEKDPNRL